jgi:hypothetical protein
MNEFSRVAPAQIVTRGISPIVAMVIGGSTAKVSGPSPPTLSHAFAATWLLNGVLARLSGYAAFIADSSRRLNCHSNFRLMIAVLGQQSGP